MNGSGPLVGVLFASVVLAVSPQTEEQEKHLEEKGWRWSTTGRLLSEGEVAAWRSRIASLDFRDTDECRNTRAGVLGVYRGGHRLGWATHVHSWEGVTYNGQYFAAGPFIDDHWIVVRPEGNGRSERNVIESLIHEALHHVRDGGHRGNFDNLLRCFTIDSGW